MLKKFTHFLFVASILVTVGCAGSYRAIQPSRLTNYQAVTTPTAPIEFGYQYSALQANGPNKKYSKKERKKGYQVVAVRIKNNTATELNFSRDLELYFGDRPVQTVPAVQAANDLKQGVAIYLLYCLLNFRVGGTYSTSSGTTEGGTFLPTGPFIAVGNMIGAGTANKNLRTEFAQYELTNKPLRPGETVYGIISLRESNPAPLRLVQRNVANIQNAPTPAPTTPTAAPAPATSGQ